MQLVPPANILMDLVDSFQLQIFHVTTHNTADVPGILQFPAGTSLNLASSIFDWSPNSNKKTNLQNPAYLQLNFA